MLRALTDLFKPNATTPLDAHSEQVALAALMVRVARTDGAYDTREIAAIDHALADLYGVSETAAQALRAKAEALEKTAPDTVRFTRAIKGAVPIEGPLRLITALWSVALADDAREPEEDALLRMVVSLLGANDRDSALARQKAQADRDKVAQSPDA